MVSSPFPDAGTSDAKAAVSGAYADNVGSIADRDTLARSTGDAVIAVAECDDIAQPADHGIRAIAGRDSVVAGAGVDDVVAVANDERLPGLQRNMRRHQCLLFAPRWCSK
jgi:hypothetical protein